MANAVGGGEWRFDSSLEGLVSRADVIIAGLVLEVSEDTFDPGFARGFLVTRSTALVQVDKTIKGEPFSNPIKVGQWPITEDYRSFVAGTEVILFLTAISDEDIRSTRYEIVYDYYTTNGPQGRFIVAENNSVVPLGPSDLATSQRARGLPADEFLNQLQGAVSRASAGQ